MLEDSGVRVTPVSVAAGATFEMDISEVRVIVVAESLAWGTGTGELSIALGDMGQFFDLSPGDNIIDFEPVRRLLLRNNTALAKKVVLLLSRSSKFRLLNTPRGL